MIEEIVRIIFTFSTLSTVGLIILSETYCIYLHATFRSGRTKIFVESSQEMKRRHIWNLHDTLSFKESACHTECFFMHVFYFFVSCNFIHYAYSHGSSAFAAAAVRLTRIVKYLPRVTVELAGSPVLCLQHSRLLARIVQRAPEATGFTRLLAVAVTEASLDKGKFISPESAPWKMQKQLGERTQKRAPRLLPLYFTVTIILGTSRVSLYARIHPGVIHYAGRLTPSSRDSTFGWTWTPGSWSNQIPRILLHPPWIMTTEAKITGTSFVQALEFNNANLFDHLKDYALVTRLGGKRN